MPLSMSDFNEGFKQGMAEGMGPGCKCQCGECLDAAQANELRTELELTRHDLRNERQRGHGFGIGRGQRYRLKDGEWRKVEG